MDINNSNTKEPETQEIAKIQNKSNQCNNCHLPQEVVPHIPLYAPYTIRNLEEGKTYLWCSCGLSKNQPWCDQSHKGTNFKPVKFKVDKKQSIYSICACKYTQDPPYCDATHTTLPFKPDFPPCKCPKSDKVPEW